MINQYEEVKNNNYYGKILNQNNSKKLKDRTYQCIKNFKAFDACGHPVIFYLAAWHEDNREIWYEYASKSFLEILKCDIFELSKTFENSIIERYQYTHEKDFSIYKEIITRLDLDGARYKLREESKQSGFVEAVYKIKRIEDNKEIWLKDNAIIENYDEDKICLSLGYLTSITKEMKAEESRKIAVEELKEAYLKLENNNKELEKVIEIANKAEKEKILRERLQGVIEMAGAVCHELNQPMQSIFGYSELLLLNKSAENDLTQKVVKIKDQINRMKEITRKLMGITRYETREYISGKKIIDIDKSSF